LQHFDFWNPFPPAPFFQSLEKDVALEARSAKTQRSCFQGLEKTGLKVPMLGTFS